MNEFHPVRNPATGNVHLNSAPPSSTRDPERMRENARFIQERMRDAGGRRRWIIYPAR